jgi:toxin ParE1/3/4
VSRAVLSVQARRDLDDIFDYIWQDNPPAATRQIHRIRRTIELLASQPLLGEKRDDLRPKLRVFSERKYVIADYPQPDGVEVVTIKHGARDIDALFRQGER